MELFLIYLITRLSDLKSGLHSISVLAGLLLAGALVARLLNELLTPPEKKEQAAKETDPKQVQDAEVFVYLGIRRSTKRGIWFFAPVFALAFSTNLVLPTSRDAIVIAGGYGLVEAVHNERVQRLFTKSAKVASQWLDTQLNGKELPANSASLPPRQASAPAQADSPSNQSSE